jgi:hypothetical protein
MSNNSSGNVYSGTLLSDTGAPLKDVEVKIRYTNPSGQSILTTVKTGGDGTWRNSLPNGIDPSTVTITFVRTGFSSFTIKNPKPTETFTFPPSQIDQYRGGTLNFKAGFESGKYLVSSLDSYDQGLLNYELSNIIKFFNAYSGSYTAIKIEASESEIPNYDREPSASNGTANSNFGKSLNQNVLSTYRANNLSTYIQKYFTDNGQPTPTVNKNPIVSKAPTPLPSPFPARDTPEYQNVLNKYKQYQYVRISAILTGPPCAEVPFDGAQFGKVDIPKPPGSKTISLNAFNFPDRFGFSATGQPTDVIYDDVFHQAPTAPGSLLSWGFFAYLKMGQNPSPPFPNQKEFGNKPYRTLVTTKDVYASLLADWFIQRDGTTNPNTPGLIGIEIYNWNKLRANEAGRSFSINPRDAKANIDYMFESTPKLYTSTTSLNSSTITATEYEKIETKVYSYTITRAPRVYDISNVPDFGTFSIYYQAGNLVAPSVFGYKICSD